MYEEQELETKTRPNKKQHEVQFVFNLMPGKAAAAAVLLKFLDFDTEILVRVSLVAQGPLISL